VIEEIMLAVKGIYAAGGVGEAGTFKNSAGGATVLASFS
jgi:hypothetical protein